MELIKQIDSITAFEDQIELAQEVSEKVEAVTGPELLPAILAMYERNATEDDFGVFHAFANYVEQFEGDDAVAGSTVAKLIAASVERVPMWKTCELLGMLAGNEAAAQTYTGMLNKGGLSEAGDEVVRSSLQDIVESFEDELSPDTLRAARAALG